MPGPYFQRRWPSFVYWGVTYPLDHLDEYTLTVVDTGQNERRIAVTFGDHCFTRSPRPGDDPALIYAESFAIIATVDRSGHPTYYGIVFGLDRVKGLSVDLRMRVKTAFPYTDREPVAYGQVRFRNLVELRMKGKSPPLITGQRRNWPEPM